MTELDRRLHIAADGSMNCERTLLGKHIFHRDTKYITEDGGKRKKIADEFRCACGRGPRNLEYVKEHWKPGRRHEEESIRD